VILKIRIISNRWVFVVNTNDADSVLTPIWLIIDYLVWITHGKSNIARDQEGDRWVMLCIETPKGLYTQEYPVDIDQNCMAYYDMLMMNHKEQLSDWVIEFLKGPIVLPFPK